MLVYFIILYILTTNAEVIVDTSHGRISGKTQKTLLGNNEYYSFMSIPYAAPPVGDLRFKPPRPLDPWNNVLSASKETAACKQFNTNVLKGQPLGVYGSEDCLYLDVFTPGLDRNRRAVITFLYNERFQNSYNKTRDYGPEFFIDEDVIVVTISHRLSVFGFLSLDDDVLPGNAGLKDIVAALKWINANIQHFGGDPNRVTLLGSQGGAAAVDILLHTKAKNLFQTAILQGGTSLSPLYLQDNAADRAYQLGEILNIKTRNKEKFLSELNEVAASDLLSNELKAAPTEYFRENQRGVLAFGPTVEKQPEGLLSIHPEDSFEKFDIPILVGFNSREGLTPSLSYLLAPEFLRYVERDFPFLMPLRLKYRFDPIQEEYYEATGEIRNFYFAQTQIKESSISDYITFIGDVLTSYPVNRMVELYSNSSSRDVFFYHFNYSSELNENKNNILKISNGEEGVKGVWGAATGDELCYIFKCPELRDNYVRLEQLKPEANIVRTKLVKMWANFAKFGNPTPDQDNPLDVKWPTYDTEKKRYLHIDSEIEVRSHLMSDRFQFWDRFIKKWEGRAVEGVVGNQHRKDEL